MKRHLFGRRTYSWLTNTTGALMATAWTLKENGTDNPLAPDTKNQRDFTTQLVISIALGLSAFLGFCFLRPRWTGLYAARKRQKNAAARLPELPDTFFGWMPVLYRITEDEVLASAGLDAFVFLQFFGMAIRFLAVALFFSLVVILPVHIHYTGDWGFSTNSTDPNANSTIYSSFSSRSLLLQNDKDEPPNNFWQGLLVPPTDFLWMYVAFTYLFTMLALYLIVTNTKKIIRVRQNFLGSQSTITDRTIRLSGIPEELRSEEKIKETVENLEIGKVDSVMLCRDWKELDDLITKRMGVLRKLEEAWTVHLGYTRSKSHRASLRRVPPPNSNGEYEHSPLLDQDENAQSHVTPYAQDRPMTRIWYGFLGLQSRRIDAIDYYEEKLRKLDEQIKTARKKEYKPTPLAFVTLDSTAACQMAVQATMDPEPMTLLAKPSPAPSDVMWPNTYLSRSNRMLRAWFITAVIIVLTVFWSVLLVPLAGLLSLESIRKVWPQLADVLESHEIVSSLVRTGLPTLVISLLNVAVPYLYFWLSNLQGMISQGEIELSLISKNFFFTFFNLFLLFTVFGTTSKAAGFFNRIGDSLRDTTSTLYILATSIQELAQFYANLIILQGLGLLPFRLLEFGSVALYPINLIGAKTPRDYAELVQPPVFSYGFFLPQTILIFIICTVYSILPGSFLVLFFGLVYFLIGGFIYKYQLLYAMDHRQHSTGRAWSIICNRIVVGLVVFQLAMAGVLALKLAIKRSILIVPLLAGTVWFIFFYNRTYEPLMKFIALRSLHRDDVGSVEPMEPRYDSETEHGRAVDEDDVTGLRFVNPSLVIPLEEMWVAQKPANGVSGNQAGSEESESQDAGPGQAQGQSPWADESV